MFSFQEAGAVGQQNDCVLVLHKYRHIGFVLLQYLFNYKNISLKKVVKCKEQNQSLQVCR